MLNRWGPHESSGASLSRWVRAWNLLGNPSRLFTSQQYFSPLSSSPAKRERLSPCCHTWLLRGQGRGWHVTPSAGPDSAHLVLCHLNCIHTVFASCLTRVDTGCQPLPAMTPPPSLVHPSRWPQLGLGSSWHAVKVQEDRTDRSHPPLQPSSSTQRPTPTPPSPGPGGYSPSPTGSLALLWRNSPSTSKPFIKPMLEKTPTFSACLLWKRTS